MGAGVILRPVALWAALLVAPAAGCTASGSSALPRPLRVAAQPFALAEIARRVGLDRVVVSDRGDSEPGDSEPGDSERGVSDRGVSDRGVVVLTPGRNQDPWLDPVAMEAVAGRVAATLSGADPGGRGAYEAAARAFRAQLGALDIDYRSSLADCGRHDIVTADAAFAPMAARYGFADHGATDAGIAEVVTAQGIPVLFTEPDIATGPVLALAQATGARVDQLDTTTVRTAGEAARGATYLSLMTDNLAKLRAALACTSGS